MTKQSAFGTALKRSGTEIANVRSINGLALSTDYEDVTTHDSTDAWEEVLLTIKRSGSLTLDLIFDPAHATHKNASGGLLYDFDQMAAVSYALEFAGGGSWTFSGYVVGFEPTAPVAGALTATVTIKPSGKITITNPA